MNQYVYKLALILLALYCNIAVNAHSISPNTVITQVAPNSINALQRTSLYFQVATEQQVVSARCYFKTNLDTQFVFVNARQTGVNYFECTLPATNENASQLNYQLLIVDVARYVIKSSIHNQKIGSATATEIQSKQTIEVHDELWGSYWPWIKDDNAQLSTVNANERYGLTAGLYQQEQIPPWFGARAGYFGGFQATKSGAAPYAVKGFASSLKAGHANLDFRFLRDEKSGGFVSQATPALNGNQWDGYFQTIGLNNRFNLGATINQSGGNVNIQTSKPGVANRFVGTVNNRGEMLVFDQFDGEDWTTFRGPATPSSVRLYDFTRPPSAIDPNPPLNSLILGRTAIPQAPSMVNASDATDLNTITITWSASEFASRYLVSRCLTDTTDSCGIISETSSLTYQDRPPTNDAYYYRLQACSNTGCSGYSVADVGKRATVNLGGVLLILLE